MVVYKVKIHQLNVRNKKVNNFLFNLFKQNKSYLH